MAIKVDESKEELMSTIKNPGFTFPIYKGQELVTVGFGSASNFWRRLVGNWDSDCKVFLKRAIIAT